MRWVRVDEKALVCIAYAKKADLSEGYYGWKFVARSDDAGLISMQGLAHSMFWLSDYKVNEQMVLRESLRPRMVMETFELLASMMEKK